MADPVSLKERTGSLLRVYPREEATLLIAGQALATWADLFRVPLPPALDSGVTRDLDYFADGATARRHFEWLIAQGFDAKVFLPELGDATSNTAKIVVNNLPGFPKGLEIDYMGCVAGFDDEHEERRLHSRSVVIELDDPPLRIAVMHPFDCLKSRIHNLDRFSSKRNERGVAQSQLAIMVLHTFLLQSCGSREQVRQVALPVIERVIDLALSRVGRYVYREFGIDVLDCVPADAVGGNFQSKRWPAAVRQVARRRAGRRNGIAAANSKRVEVSG
ncbi:hypothetical protein [Arenimonas terrae]|uniref:Uncharacterized protein n=1 Tax=Arenimonas terrae TaxID=2546226 RepID=A0A5C4RXL2_9GAMM|nr:hypothetical protein [Arenimonas terrae]TNJ35447.1 hypothetical protein E1B00_06740 [Arenimonas terrae]